MTPAALASSVQSTLSCFGRKPLWWHDIQIDYVLTKHEMYQNRTLHVGDPSIAGAARAALEWISRDGIILQHLTLDSEIVLSGDELVRIAEGRRQNFQDGDV